jgi:hypothetical protein
MNATCQRCERPMPDQAFACASCADRASQQLAEIVDLTPAARDVAHGLSKRQGGGGGSGKPGSRLPFDLTATSKLDAVQGELIGWVRHIAEERGVAVDLHGPGKPRDLIVGASEWLQGGLEWLRHRQEVSEALSGFDAAVRVVRGIARGPREQKYLGPCGAERRVYLDPEDFGGFDDITCEGDVYGPTGGHNGTCRTCGATVDQGERKAWLDDEVRSRAFRAVEIEDAYGVSANLIRQWATPARGLVNVHAQDREGRALYLLAEVLDVAAGQAAKRAEAQAKRARRAAQRESEDAA